MNGRGASAPSATTPRTTRSRPAATITIRRRAPSRASAHATDPSWHRTHLDPRRGHFPRAGGRHADSEAVLDWCRAAAALRPRHAVRRPRCDRQDTTTVRNTSVVYLTGASIYIGAGRADGLVEGQNVTVVRHARGGGDAAGRLPLPRGRRPANWCRASPMSSWATSSATARRCRVPPLPASAWPAAPGPPDDGSGARDPRSHRRGAVPGRRDRRQRRLQPALGRPALRRAGRGGNAGGPGSRCPHPADHQQPQRRLQHRGRPHSALPGGAVLESAGVEEFRLVAGRQYLTAVTSVSLFDGGLMEVGGSHLTLGAFGGTEPITGRSRVFARGAGLRRLPAAASHRRAAPPGRSPPAASGPTPRGRPTGSSPSSRAASAPGPSPSMACRRSITTAPGRCSWAPSMARPAPTSALASSGSMAGGERGLRQPAQCPPLPRRGRSRDLLR